MPEQEVVIVIVVSGAIGRDESDAIEVFLNGGHVGSIAAPERTQSSSETVERAIELRFFNRTLPPATRARQSLIHVYPGFRFASPWALCLRLLRRLEEAGLKHHSQPERLSIVV